MRVLFETYDSEDEPMESIEGELGEVTMHSIMPLLDKGSSFRDGVMVEEDSFYNVFFQLEDTESGNGLEIQGYFDDQCIRLIKAVLDSESKAVPQA